MTRRLTLDERYEKRFADAAATRRCGSKKRFGSKREVKSVIKNTFAAHPLGFYKCPVCRGFHLTSRLRLADSA